MAAVAVATTTVVAVVTVAAAVAAVTTIVVVAVVAVITTTVIRHLFSVGKPICTLPCATGNFPAQQNLGGVSTGNDYLCSLT